ncbi:MAG: hypothetical protein GY706_05525, partial [Bacteroides sp.]|nr:hypothetical protein [Bacteroides sp.]
MALTSSMVKVTSFAKARFGRLRPYWIQLALLLVAGIFMMSIQNPDTGFRRGHRGWVTSHLLAMISHANWEYRFVAPSMRFDRENKGKSHRYFDRYPVFFTVFMHNILYTFDLSLSQRVHLVRQTMNGLHIITLFVVFFLLLELGVPRWIAFAATCMAASGHHFVYYR